MKTTAKYLFFFTVLSLATLSLNGSQGNIGPLNNFINTSELVNVWLGKPQSLKFSCDKNTTAVFKYEPQDINENVIKSDLIYKEKLNTLTETVKKY